LGDEDKSYQASAQKLRKAREQGQVFKSQDLTTAIFLIVIFVTAISMAPFIWHEMAVLFITIFEQIPNKNIEEIGWQFLLLITAKTLAFVITPFLAMAILLAIIGNVMQFGFLIATKALSPNFNSLNPVNGLKNLFKINKVVELVKNILKVLIFGYVGYSVLMESLPELLRITETDNIFIIFSLLGSVLMKYIIMAGIAFLVLGLADLLFQRWKFMKDQKMSFKEVKDEYKQSEGDPMVKAQLRQRRMQMLQQRMLEAVPTADVVTTNPIHIAVALKYNSDTMEAPKVVAKGTELFASKIKEIARQHDIPIVENPALARTLYKLVDVDHEIPPDLYQAVAEILMFAWRSKGRRV
jgi:flagellar biosynthetic protein FlhB